MVYGKYGTLGVPDVRAVPTFIYGLVDPRDKTIRYVGRTQNPDARFRAHLSSSAGRSVSRAVKSWVHALKCNGLVPEMVILKRLEAGEDADVYELMAIRALRRRENLLLNDYSVEVRARHRRDRMMKPRRQTATAEPACIPEQLGALTLAQPTEQPVFELGSAVPGARELPRQNSSHRVTRSELTSRQREVLQALADMIDAHGFSPTYRELGDRLGIASTNAVNDHISALERKGFIARDRFSARSLRLVRASEKAS